MNELVKERLREIVLKHGRSPVSDPRLCESLLKDYCGQYKKEIFVLVCAVREQAAADLLTSQESVPQEILHPLLIKRLQNNLALTEEASKWAVETWSQALAELPLEEAPKNLSSQRLALDEISLPSKTSEERISFSGSISKFEGEVIGRCKGAVRAVACAPDGESIVCGGDDATLRLWRFETGRMEVLGNCAGAVTSVAYSPDGLCVAAASEETSQGAGPRISIRELQTGEMIELGECSGRSTRIVYSPGGHSLAAASSDTENSLRMWNLRTGHARVFKSEAAGLASISFSPVARIVVTGESHLGRAALHLRDLDAGDQPRLLGHCDGRITSLAFSPDGKHFVSGSWDETVRLWNVKTGQVRVLGKNCSRVNCVAFSRSGEHIAACSLDGRIRIWNVQTAKCRTIGECHGINSATFAADGKSLIAGSQDGTLRQWHLFGGVLTGTR